MPYTPPNNEKKTQTAKYSCIWFYNTNYQDAKEGVKCFKLKFVKNVWYASKWVDNKINSNWHHINVYERKTGKFITRFYKNDKIYNP